MLNQHIGKTIVAFHGTGPSLRESTFKGSPCIFDELLAKAQCSLKKEPAKMKRIAIHNVLILAKIEKISFILLVHIFDNVLLASNPFIGQTWLISWLKIHSTPSYSVH